MGNKASTQNPFFESEWRKVDWKNAGGPNDVPAKDIMRIQNHQKATTANSVKEFKPANQSVKHVRILLHGPVGSGKSSFINSVNNILQGRMTHDALVATGSGKSFTKNYQTHQIQKGEPGNYYPFVFTDLMGLEESKGIHESDVTLAMKGHMKEGYRFKSAPMANEDPLYNHEPTPDDKTHVLVCVVPADQVAVLSPGLIEKMQRIRLAARDIGIPQICIITKIDQADPLMAEDLKHVYTLKAVKEKMEEFSAKVGIPMNCIFPVKNYHEETDLNDDLDVLIFKALQQMINLGDDFINRMMNPYDVNSSRLINI